MSHMLEKLVDAELNSTVNPPVDILKAPVLAEAIENILNDNGIYIGDVYRNDFFINVYLETPDEKPELLVNKDFGGRILTLDDFIDSLPSLNKEAFPNAQKAADEIKDLLKNIDRLQELTSKPFRPSKNDRPRKDVYLVCVYPNEVNPYGNTDDLVYIEVEEKDLEDFLDGPLQGECSLEQFLDEYTADDTVGLPEFLKKRNKLVLPEEILYDRAVADFYLSSCKYAEDYVEHSKDYYEDEVMCSSNDALLYVIKEDFLPHMPSSKRKDAEKYLTDLNAGKIPSSNLESKVVKSPNSR